MRHIVLGLVLVPLAACGGWGYEARPADGNGEKDDHPRCFVVERHETPWHAMRETYYQEGLFCEVPADEIPAPEAR